MKWNDLPFLVKVMLAALVVLVVLFVMHIVDPKAAETSLAGLKRFMEAIFGFLYLGAFDQAATPATP